MTTRTEISAKILAAGLQWLRDAGMTHATAHSTMQTLGLDSLDMMELLMGVEDGCDIDITDAALELNDNATMQQWAEAASKNLVQ